jgi:hypothetical protein
MPVGFVLAFSAGVGIIAMALIQPLWSLAISQSENDLDDEEFSFED